jgi:hypothetical protein
MIGKGPIQGWKYPSTGSSFSFNRSLPEAMAPAAVPRKKGVMMLMLPKISPKNT